MLADAHIALEDFDTSSFPEKAELRDRLSVLQRECADAGLPVIVVFEGWDAAGKGSLIHTLTERLDPRGFDVHPIRAPRDFELSRPWLWRYWLKIPPAGKWAFFDRSWYGRVLVQRVEGMVTKKERKRAIDDIIQFERTLIDNGYLLIKLFLHIEKDEQKRRLNELKADPATSWKVTDEDWTNHRRYLSWYKIYEKTLKHTSTEASPWQVIPTGSAQQATVLVYEVLIREIEKVLIRTQT